MNKRRKFIISSLSGLALATLPRFTYASSNPDVVVIGAGAAGLAATNYLIQQGKSVICVEAGNRIGGRAVTDNTIFGEPYDMGALWLENGSTNPFKIYGEKNSKKWFKKSYSSRSNKCPSSCSPLHPTKVNIHIVPHTHLDPGWLQTVDQYYTNKVKYIMNSVTESLLTLSAP